MTWKLPTEDPPVPDIYEIASIASIASMASIASGSITCWTVKDGSMLNRSSAEPQHCAKGRMRIANDCPEEVTLPYQSMPSMPGATKPTETTKQVTTYSPRRKLRSTCCPCLKIVLIFILWGLSRVLLGILEYEGLQTMETCSTLSTKCDSSIENGST